MTHQIDEEDVSTITRFQTVITLASTSQGDGKRLELLVRPSTSEEGVDYTYRVISGLTEQYYKGLEAAIMHYNGIGLDSPSLTTA